MRLSFGALLLAAAVAFAPVVVLRAADDEEKGEKNDVAKKQEAIQKAYDELERKIHSIAVAISRTDPEKAARLQRAYSASRDEEIASRMGEVLKLLGKKDFSTANVGQKEVVDAIERILEILESDDPKKDAAKLDPKRLEQIEKDLKKVLDQEKKHKEASAAAKKFEDQAKALEDAAKKVQELIDKQKKAIGDTREAPAEGLPKVAPDQKDVENKAGEVAKDLDSLAGPEAKPGEAKPGEAKPGEARPGEGTPGEGKPGEAKPGEGKPGEGKPGEGKPGEGKPGEGKPGEGKPGDQAQQAQSAAQAVRDAQKAMAEAAKALDEKAKDPALERERQALDDLTKAKEALDKKRMEVERLARFEKMKADQAETRRETEEVAKRMGPQQGGGSQKSGQGKKNGGQQGGGQGEVPGKRNVERAEDEMKKAGDDLENRHASGAEEKQEEAVKNLEKALEDVREALVQARRREQEEVLKALGQRFVLMLEKQKDLTKRTEAVDAERVAAKQETLSRKQIIEVGKLSTGEAELRDDATGALDLVREEGSTAILPTVISEVALDLAKLAQLLDKKDTGRFVVSLQKDVERSLEELIEVIKKEIEERKKNGGAGGGGGGGGGDNEEPLLPASAELKMIRAQQVRVNQKTKDFDVGRTPENELAPEQREACRHIAEKQGRVAEFTRKLHQKLNKED